MVTVPVIYLVTTMETVLISSVILASAATLTPTMTGIGSATVMVGSNISNMTLVQHTRMQG